MSRWRASDTGLLSCLERLDTAFSAELKYELDETRTFLYANDDLDPGRECRGLLERILFGSADMRVPVTQADLGLESSCWRAPKHDEKHQATVYRFDVVVKAPDQILDRIHRVEYHLPPAWDDLGRNRARQVIVERQGAFKLKDLTYSSDLDVYADVHVWGQREPVQLWTRVLVPRFTLAFSYARSDDRDGWVSKLRSSVEARLRHKLGQPGASVLVPVLSPAYTQSEACLLELRAFLQSPQAASQVVPVMKYPVENLPRELCDIQTIPLFHISLETHTPRELEPAEPEFESKVASIAAAITHRLDTDPMSSLD